MTRSETLDKAKACVCGQRENEYGSPEDNFTAIAGFWSVYKGVEFTANDVAMMMALLKIARIRTGTATDDGYGRQLCRFSGLCCLWCRNQFQQITKRRFYKHEK